MADKSIRVLQFSQLINRYDFMDVIVRHADPSQFDVLACTFTKNSNIQKPEYEKDGYEHISLDLPFNKYGFLLAIFKLASVLRRQNIDVVHAHHYYEAFISRLALFFVPKCKLVITRHYHNELFLTTTGLKLKLYLWIEKVVNKKSCIVISPSTQITDLLIQSGVDNNKIRFIAYGFDFTGEKYKPIHAVEVEKIRNGLGVGEGGILIGNFARHHTIKGQDLMLRSFAEIARHRKNIHLIMIGHGPYHSELVELASELGINDSVKFLGWQKNINPFLSAVDIVWHPTLQEAFPQIMVESMALSKVLVITPVSGATDIVKDGINGYFIPFNDPVKWTETILELLDNREKLKEVGINASRAVSTALDIKMIIGQIEQVYLDCA